jgi:uncharacterized membrane protein
MTRTGIIAILMAVAVVVLVLAVTPGMRDAGFIVRAYVITAVILGGYVWSLARRVDRAEKAGSDRDASS